MWWRIFYGIARIILGVTLLWLVGTHFTDLLHVLMRQELLEDPSDSLLRFVEQLLVHSDLTVTSFMSLYLIFWGTADIFLSISLLKRKLWAFPISIWLIIIFVMYELYRFYHTHSLVLAYIIVVDIVVVTLIHFEYKKIRLDEARRIFYLSNSTTTNE